MRLRAEARQAPASAPPLDTADTRLGRAATPQARAHPGESGVVALSSGSSALAARILLADAAQHSLDVQYYIWNADASGTLLLDALCRAAARGVRVRMLLDDNNTRGLDNFLADIAARPNVEVRLFNPFALRRWRLLSLLLDLARLNRRMHNKAFIADAQVAVVGGRNIGDEYFGLGSEPQFVDLDVMAIGAVVGDVGAAFDRYWNCRGARPVLALLAATDATRTLDRQARALQDDPAIRRWRERVVQEPIVADMLAQRLRFDWTRVQLVCDEPGKIVGKVRKRDLMWTRLKGIVGRPRSEVVLSSPYFVPGRKGMRDFSRLAGSGVDITILTNALEATDVPAVHAGYAKRRRALLRRGIALYELKRGADDRAGHEPGEAPHPGARPAPRTGSSGSSLHAKAFTVDGRLAFVGSFNFDQRSVHLNTEMGFVIESPALAGSMARTMTDRLAESAYRVRLTERGRLQWVETIGGREIVHDREPGTTVWRRQGVWILSLLPIEWLL